MYGGRDDLEIVIADDGSPTDTAEEALAHAPFTRTLPVLLINLPRKDGPLNPCVPINRAAGAANGEFLVLTNPETTHRTPILPAMREIIRSGGTNLRYVLAAVYCPDSGSWHCHSQHASAGYHFCTMLHRDLWEKAGGFDEDYREGYCYDDPDFVERVKRAGAVFTFRDELVADHHQFEAKASMPMHLWERNRDLFFAKWPNRIPMNRDDEARLQNWK
jgi:glycosyltransferase involved in cell wall biosynthesis